MITPYATVIHLADTDAAGRLYFASAGRIAHEAFEKIMADLGFPIGAMIRDGAYGLPVVHADLDFPLPLNVGDAITVRSRPDVIGEKSVTFRHDIIRADGATAVSVGITHVAVSGADGCAMPLPLPLRQAFERITPDA